jgi:hypothetical protein
MRQRMRRMRRMRLRSPAAKRGVSRGREWFAYPCISQAVPFHAFLVVSEHKLLPRGLVNSTITGEIDGLN